MNNQFFILALLLLVLGCTQTDSTKQTGTSANDPTKLEGAWELVENRADGQLVQPVRPQQLKMFHDGFFSFIMYSSDGAFEHAGAGTYTVDGNRFRETFRYYSDTTWVGYTDEQTWRFEGDTLIFEGYKQVTDRNGKAMPPNTWGGDRFVEKRVRARP